MTTTEKCQKSLLGGLEKYWSTRLSTVATSVPKVLMQLYQADVLDEEVIQQWGTHVSKKYVDKEQSKTIRKASEPFLKVREAGTSTC
jgi:translation initiation factor 5